MAEKDKENARLQQRWLEEETKRRVLKAQSLELAIKMQADQQANQAKIEAIEAKCQKGKH